MKILITGASSGIGRDIARKAAMRYDRLVLVGRSRERLEALRDELTTRFPVQVDVEVLDLSEQENCIRLFEKHKDVHLLVNNAGFGDTGCFDKTDLQRDTQMIQTNIIALHTLMKLYLGEMKRRGRGHILNTASMAGYFPGPRMAVYYATKAYVISLTEAVREELRREHSPVRVSLLCPGPVSTGFGEAARVDFKTGGFHVSSEYIASYALSHLDRFRLIPTLPMKAAALASHVVPRCVSAAILYRIQSRPKDPSSPGN